MQRWHLLGIPIGTLSMISALALIHPNQVFTSTIESTAAIPSSKLSTIHSLDKLYQARVRLHQESQRLHAFMIPPPLMKLGIFSKQQSLIAQLQEVRSRIQAEEQAQENWELAQQWATEAVKLGKVSNPSIEKLKQTQYLWRKAVLALEQVPDNTALSLAAAKKIADYQKNLASVSYRYDTERSGFLETIAAQTGLPTSDVFITLCHTKGECRRWQGNKLPASPASLIKVPVAIALMHKLEKEGISLETKVLITHGNYTEDASDIWVGQEYTLRHIMTRMIDQSSNIATNQLIDYLGRDYINQTMKSLGYDMTFVDYKLVGETIYPANAGSIPNRFTTDELTEMMRQIYNRQHPGDLAIDRALSSQKDKLLGYAGLKGTDAVWIGEKTGQNSQMLGTTVAFAIDGEYYVTTVALNYSGNEAAVRHVVNAIAKHIQKEGHL